MPVPNEDQVGSYLDQSELDTGDWTMLENVHQGYSVISGGTVTAQGSPNGTVAVAAGVAKVGHAAVTITAGNVSVISGSANPDGTTATTADSVLARFSLITINSSGQLGVLHGTPAGLGPTNDNSYLVAFPTFASKTILGAVFVPPAATTVTTAQINDKRVIRTDGDFVARAITPTALSATADNYAPTGLTTANTIRQATSNTTQRNISGIVPTGFLDGRALYLHNLGPGPLGLLDESTNSTAANRLSLTGDLVLPVDRSVTLLYDVTSSRWRAVGAQTAAGAPTIALGTTAAPGALAYYVASDATIAAFDATVPVTQAYSDAAATGSAAFAARRDHRHGMPAGPAGLVASLTAPTAAIANTETVILSGIIAANSLAAGDSFQVKATGVGTTSTSPGNGTFRLRFNPVTLTGTSVAFVTVPMTASRTAKGWTVEFIVNVYTIGATGTIQGEGVAIGGATTGNNDLLTGPCFSLTTSALTADTTVANLMELTWVSGAATANITAYSAFIRKV